MPDVVALFAVPLGDGAAGYHLPAVGYRVRLVLVPVIHARLHVHADSVGAVNGDEQCTLTLSELRKMFFTSGATGLLGDANNDGEVNLSDVMLTVDHSMGQTTENFHFELADIDGNGEISVADIMGIVGIIMGT